MSIDEPSEGPIATLRAFADSAKLPTPPVPEQFADRLMQVEGSTWASENVDSDDLYMFRQTVIPRLEELGTDSYAFSFGGHGMNSYAITLRIAVPGLTLALQTLWGGVYMDESATVDAASMIESARACLAAAAEVEGYRQCCVAASSFRGVGYVGWLDELDALRPISMGSLKINSRDWPSLAIALGRVHHA